MLLQQEVADGVEVLCVRGPVDDDDAQPLLSAVHEALAHGVRAVVLDLGQAGRLSDGLCCALDGLPRLAQARGSSSVVVRPPAGAPGMTGWRHAEDRDQALALVERRAWPRRRIEVEHGPTGPAKARSAVAASAQALGLGQACDDVLLLVSEMVTNAVRHARPPVHLEISAGEQDVVVAVCDGSPEPPEPRPAGDDAEGGRGMLLVDLLTTDHGVRTDPPDGKAVWARLHRDRAS